MALPCSNVNLMDIRRLNGMPCSCTNGLRRFHQLPPSSPERCNIVLARMSARGHGIHFLPVYCHLELQTGRPLSIGQASRLLSLRPCQVKSEGTEGTLSGESILMDEQTLKQDLQIAIDEEDYAQAAKIRDSLRLLHEDSKSSVLAANARFYDAFRNGDLATMQALWARGDNVCCVHPGANGISGYDFVMESWEVVWMNYDFPLEIELKNVRVHVRGNVGYVTCIEFVKTKGGSWGGQFVTNVFERIDDQWLICIHHASPVDL